MTDQELDRLLSQAAPMARDLWLSSLPGDGELPQARPSPAFQRRMDRLIRRMGRSPRRVRALAQVRRAAAVALVFLAVGFSGLMVTSQAFRAQVLEVLTQITEDFSYFFFSAESTTSSSAGDFVLTYLPDGVQETGREGDDIQLHLFFESSAGDQFRVYIPETLSASEKDIMNGLENSPNFQPKKSVKEKISISSDICSINILWRLGIKRLCQELRHSLFISAILIGFRS